MSKKIAKRIAIDAAGYGLVILGIVLMPVPGPGGLPVMLAGLGLLSLENNWAKKMKQWLIDNGHTMTAKLFPENKTIQKGYDVLGVLVFVSALIGLNHVSGRLADTVALAGVSGGLMILALNRQRIDKISKFLKNKTKL